MKGGPKKQREEEAPVYDIERRDGVTIRRVRPMVQAFETFAKGRWVGREILEVVTKEFGGHTAEYWQSAFHHGHLRINGQPVPPTYRFQNSDRFLHRTHRHEPPILGEVQFLGETRDYFAVNKPASVPVHPCGAFRYNSLEKILLYEPLTPTQPSPLHLVHRLDKVTSGLVIFAKSAEAAAIISRDIQAKSTTKRYLARVKGRFPEQLLQLLHPLEESEIYHYAGDAGDGDEADDGGDAAAADGAAVEGDAPPSHGKKRPSTAEPPGASSSAATGASRAERKRQRQEQYGATTGPSAASAACAASATDGPVAAGAVVHVAGKSADCAAHRTAPALDDVRAHPAVGYYRRRDAGDGDGDGDGDDAYFYVQCPLDVVSKRNGVHACYPPPYGRPSVTKMRLVSFCAASQTSLVECQPVTGRTHQIRLHSQLAGHPIANDPCYGGELFYHDPEKQAQCRAAQELLEACGIAPLSRVLHQPTTAPASAATPATWALPAIERRVGETDDALLERSCRYCAALRQFPQLRDVEVHLHCDGIWLHAWQYAKTRPPPPSTATEGRGGGGGGGGGGEEGDEFWAFEAPPPAWAADTLPLPLAATAAAAAAAVPVPSTATDAAPPSR